MKFLVKSKENKIRKNICPICVFTESRIGYVYFYEETKFEILECLKCQHLYIHPVPLELNLRRMDTLDGSELFGSKILRFLYEKIVIDKEIRNVKRFLKSRTMPTLLDIGSGTGYIPSIWQKNGFDVTGLESSPVRSQYAVDSYKLKIFTGFIEDFDQPTQFDVIIMRHILEHLERPVDVLNKLETFLKIDGVLLITVPNINSIGRYIFRNNWEWVLPWHLHFFRPKTLKRLLLTVDVKILKIYQTPGSLWYPEALQNVLGTESYVSRLLSKVPRVAMILLFTPVIFLGMLLGLNDNLTIISKKIA